MGDSEKCGEMETAMNRRITQKWGFSLGTVRCVGIFLCDSEKCGVFCGAFLRDSENCGVFRWER